MEALHNEMVQAAIKYKASEFSWYEEIADYKKKTEGSLFGINNIDSNASPDRFNQLLGKQNTINVAKIVDDIIQSERAAYVSAKVGGFSAPVVTDIAGDSTAGDSLTKILGKMMMVDRIHTKVRSMIDKAYEQNSSIMFVSYADNKNANLTFKTKVRGAKDILFDPTTENNDIQTSRFVGIENIKLSEHELKALFKKNDEHERMVLIGNLNHVNNLYGSNIDNEIEFYQMFVYDQEKDKTYMVIAEKQSNKIVYFSGYESVAVLDGSVVRFPIQSVTINPDGFFAKSRASSSLPSALARAKMINDVLKIVQNHADNPIITSPMLYESMKRAVIKGERIVQPDNFNDPSEQLANQVTAAPLPDPSLVTNILTAVAPYLKNNPEQTDEIRGVVQKRNASVYRGNVSSLQDQLGDAEIIPFLQNDIALLFIKILKEFATSKFFVRADDSGGMHSREVVVSSIVGEKGEAVNGLSITFEDNNTSSELNELNKRDLFVVLQSSPNFNRKNVEDFILRKFDKPVVRVTDEDIFVFRSPFSSDTTMQFLKDYKELINGKDVSVPKNMGRGYSLLLSRKIDKDERYFKKSDGSYNPTGERVIKFYNDVIDELESNLQDGNAIFQENDFIDEQNQINHETASAQPNQDPGDAAKSVFATQGREI